MEGMLAPFAAFAALSLAAVSLGGAFYECLLVDRIWPAKIQLIQPEQGGLNRKLFWMPVHFAFEFALVAALWLIWPHSSARMWLLIAAASHLLMRIWSGIYFIPRALEFERARHLTPQMQEKARTWVRLSIWRIPLEFATLLALCGAVSAFLIGR
ncbi:MAG TPA: hypothetical protein VNS34_24505 [Rhizobiaceae bacterium]|nr:hypothetical protein [Rhizobiaceae bacterium]